MTLEQLAHKYGLKLYYGKVDPSITLVACSLLEVTEAMNRIADEISSKTKENKDE